MHLQHYAARKQVHSKIIQIVIQQKLA